jgi:hypothetical protein
MKCLLQFFWVVAVGGKGGNEGAQSKCPPAGKSTPTSALVFANILAFDVYY